MTQNNTFLIVYYGGASHFFIHPVLGLTFQLAYTAEEHIESVHARTARHAPVASPNTSRRI